MANVMALTALFRGQNITCVHSTVKTSNSKWQYSLFFLEPIFFVNLKGTFANCIMVLNESLYTFFILGCGLIFLTENWV